MCGLGPRSERALDRNANLCRRERPWKKSRLPNGARPYRIVVRFGAGCLALGPRSSIFLQCERLTTESTRSVKFWPG